MPEREHVTRIVSAYARRNPLDAVTTRPRLIAKPQAHTVAAELAQQPVQCRGCVGDPAVLPHLAAQTARRHRDDNPFLVNIKPNVGDTIRPMTRLLCMRLGTGLSGATLVTCTL